MHRRNFLQATGLIPFLGTQLLAGSASANKTSPCLFVNNTNTGQRDFFYKPVDAWAADFIPLFADGAFQLFYLLDWRDTEHHGEGTPWYRVSTKNFVDFTEHGELLKRGTKAEQDLYVFTGSAIQVKDEFHIFYTGHNPYLAEQGNPMEGVMHAVSKDMKTWVKHPEQTFFAPADKYEKNDWRDPFVFWNPDTKEYNMLLAARHKQGIDRRRGLTALCGSKDLITWEVRDPFYAPDLYFTHECPDLFKMGDWWYLLFSEFTDKVRTRYRMSRSLKGPWITPARDDFDGHAYYAAKSASDGTDRFLFGWNPTRAEAKDTGSWDWGGNLVVHQLFQQENGELAVKVPKTVSAAFTKPSPLSFKEGTGKYRFNQQTVVLNAAGTFAAAVGGPLPDLCRISCSIKFDKGSKAFGLMFRTDKDLNNSYYIRIEPANGRVVFDKWPRERAEVSQMVELERPLEMNTEMIGLLLILEGNKGVAYINDLIALNFRAYDLPAGNWGFFAEDGSVTFSDIAILTI